MRELRRGDAERLIKLDVLGRVGKMVLAADDVADPHLDVVHDVDEMENPRAVRAADRHVGLHVAERIDGLGAIHLHATANEVVHDDQLARELETGRSFVVHVTPARVLQSGEVAFVNVIALTLEVRPVVATFARAFVPIQPEPFQTVVNDLHGIDGVAGLVGVLDAQDKLAAVVPREQPVEQRRPRPADVQKAGG